MFSVSFVFVEEKLKSNSYRKKFNFIIALAVSLSLSLTFSAGKVVLYIAMNNERTDESAYTHSFIHCHHFATTNAKCQKFN